MSVDVYRDLDALKRELRRGQDYRVRCCSRRSRCTIIAPHGGFIDAGTSALARAIAMNEYNLYDFQGLVAQDSFRLHITSHRFHDSLLTELLENSMVAISIHGMGDHTRGDEIWVGGLNKELRDVVHASLVRAGFAANKNPPKYRGEHPKNVVNGAQLKGVQIEIPISLRVKFYRHTLFHRNGRCPKTTILFHQFVQAVRMAIREYMQTA